MEKTPMKALTLAVAEFAATIEPEAIPDLCRHGARIGMLDCIGVMIAGVREEAVRLVAATVATSTANDGAPEIPSGRNLAPADAALVNGTAAHVLDYDDVGMDGHPSAVLTSAILAEGWALGTSGRDALTAYVAGYEVWALLLELEPGCMHERGFHPTAIWGTLACAAACARLNRLDAAQTTNAIAIAASLAAGVVANFGTMTKSLHVGRTAQAGVLAARLAKSGFTGSSDALEHASGFMRAHSPSGRPDLAVHDLQLGQKWRMAELGINIKRYPMCYATHRAIDAMIDLVSEHDLDTNSIDTINVRIGDAQGLMLRNHDPVTALEAKFSIEFAMAAALIARRVSLKELDDTFVCRDDVKAAMHRVCTSTTDERMADMPFAPDDRVSVVLRTGETLAHAPVTRPKGSWQKPLSENELHEKFMDCAGTGMPEAKAASLFERLGALDRLANLRDLPLCMN
jgi:2-methylcitrate dehydratase PrpD